jgi:2-amino-4-hydroxy-6-hydroxymethyldihydropteridine diphosphokinase
MTGRVAAYVGLGANLGEPAQAVRDATGLLSQLPDTTLICVSSLYASAPIDAGGNDYVNAVAHIDTLLDAHALLRELQRIEQVFGRERLFRNAPRTLDLDLLLYGGETIHDHLLDVPHPRMQTRAFVLLPLLELAPTIEIPGIGHARDWLAGVQDQRITKMPDNGLDCPSGRVSG